MAIDPCIQILLNIKRQYDEQEKHRAEYQLLLENCTNLKSPEGSILLDNLSTATFKLGEIYNELKRLEYTHIKAGGHLPYQPVTSP